MARIIKVNRCENKGDYARVYVQLDDGSEAMVYVGGAVELFFSAGQTKAHVKRAQSRGKLDNINKLV